MSPLWSLDTRVYRRGKGWAGVDAISVGDEVLAGDPEAATWCWSRVRSTVMTDGAAAGVVLTPRGFDLHLADQAMVLWQDKRRNWRRTRVADMNSKSFVPVTIVPSTGAEPVDLGDDHLELAAWCLTDGWLFRSGRMAIWHVAQREQKMPRVLACAERLGLSPRVTERHRNHTHIMGKELKKVSRHFELRFPAAQSRQILEWLPSKDLPEWAWHLSDGQFTHFLSCMVEGDGTRHKHTSTAVVMYGTRDFLEQFQGACLVHGWNASFHEERPGSWRLNVCRQSRYQLPTEFTTGTADDAVLWGLELDAPTVWIERKGRPALLPVLGSRPTPRPPNKPMTAEAIRRRGAKLKGRKKPRHMIEALRQANLGRVQSAAERAAMSRRTRGAWLTTRLVSPDGVTHEVTNATAFAQEHGLWLSTLIRLLLGKAKSCSAWTRFEG